MPETLQAPMKVEFDYTRSLGPVLSRFMSGLRERRVLGARLSDGRVAVPPPEYDPVTLDPVEDLVEVAAVGVVRTWSWVSEPVQDQPLDRPFAYALVLLDGADTPLLHAVDAGSPDAMETGMRVQARWREEPVGAITDIACFEPIRNPAPRSPASAEELQRDPGIGGDSPALAGDLQEPLVTGITSPVRLAYDYAASPEESKFYRGLAEGRILGQRCPRCQKVYVPPRGACPVDGVPTTDEVELPDKGTVTTFCIVNVPFMGQKITPPYVSAYVLLDGADIAFLHLVLEAEADEVRMGMRVEAVWRPHQEWGTTIENISHFRPTGEPDADYETYKQHL
ncbi:MAG TPA: OB-fold domain-containing protein [Marmoricola sp.]|nr:OB-fold domain-containing protein [Marmoricola sp.]